MTAFDNLQELIDLMDGARGVTELTVSGAGGALITIKRRPDASGAAIAGFSTAELCHSPSQAEISPSDRENTAAPAPQADPLVSIAANRVGIFHPARPGVETGETIAAGQIVGYIESMKLMNEVRADISGRVDEQLVEDGVPVEYGQPLFGIVAA